MYYLGQRFALPPSPPAHETSGKAWSHPGLSPLWGGGASRAPMGAPMISGWRPGRLLNTLQQTGQRPQNKDKSSQRWMVPSSGFCTKAGRKPGRVCEFLFAENFSERIPAVLVGLGVWGERRRLKEATCSPELHHCLSPGTTAVDRLCSSASSSHSDLVHGLFLKR